jgi:hypothetical protein
MTGKEQKVMTGRVSIVIIPLLDESRGYIGILKSVRPSHFWFPDNNKYRSTKSFQTLTQCCGPLNTG